MSENAAGSTHKRPDVTRLPKWAQNRITHLERELEGVKQYANEALGEATGAPGSMSWGDYLRPNRPLPRGVFVRFHFDKGDYIDVAFRRGAVDIHGSYAIRLEPHASNHVSVEVLHV